MAVTKEIFSKLKTIAGLAKHLSKFVIFQMVIFWLSGCAMWYMGYIIFLGWASSPDLKILIWLPSFFIFNFAGIIQLIFYYNLRTLIELPNTINDVIDSKDKFSISNTEASAAKAIGFIRLFFELKKLIFEIKDIIKGAIGVIRILNPLFWILSIISIPIGYLQLVVTIILAIIVGSFSVVF